MQKAIETLKNGGIILYPTDTVWGIGCDATNEKAVKKIIKLKERESDKSFIILLDNDLKLNRYVKQIPDIAWDLIEFSTKPTTIIYPEGYNLASNVLAKDKSIGIRIVTEGFCNELLRKFGKPIVSTSANFKNQPTPLSFKDIDKRILAEMDYVLPLQSENKKDIKSSKIIKLGIHGRIEFIRK